MAGTSTYLYCCKFLQLACNLQCKSKGKWNVCRLVGFSCGKTTKNVTPLGCSNNIGPGPLTWLTAHMDDVSFRSVMCSLTDGQALGETSSLKLIQGLPTPMLSQTVSSTGWWWIPAPSCVHVTQTPHGSDQRPHDLWPPPWAKHRQSSSAALPERQPQLTLSPLCARLAIFAFGCYIFLSRLASRKPPQLRKARQGLCAGDTTTHFEVVIGPNWEGLFL